MALFLSYLNSTFKGIILLINSYPHVSYIYSEIISKWNWLKVDFYSQQMRSASYNFNYCLTCKIRAHILHLCLFVNNVDDSHSKCWPHFYKKKINSLLFII